MKEHWYNIRTVEKRGTLCGCKAGVFECVTSSPKYASDIAKELYLDNDLTYRLLRALGSLRLLREDANHDFSITGEGEFLRRDNPQTLRAIALLEGGHEHYAHWKRLHNMIKDGKQNAFPREYGKNHLNLPTVILHIEKFSTKP